MRPFGDWAAFGVRDPSVLVTPDGTFVEGPDGYVMFFNARDRRPDEGGVTVVGRATSRDGEHWTPEPEPVLRDGVYAAQGSAVLLDSGEVVMPYSPDTLAGFRLSKAPDATASFEPVGDIVLSPADIDCHRIGLPFIWREADGWHMVFEAIRRGGHFEVFHATSDDLETWSPDQVRYFAPPADAWDGYSQANPSVHRTDRGRVLLYNGASDVATWDVSVAVERAGAWRTLDRPILARIDDEPWSRQRLEGARLRPNAGPTPELFYFGTPGRDSYEGGTIGLATATG